MRIKKYIQFINEEINGYKYGCVMIEVPVKNWEEITSFIEPEDIFEGDGDDTKGIQKNPHVTLLYGLHDEVTIEQVKSVFNEFAEINIEVDGIGIFENDKFDVVKFNVKPDGALLELYNRLSEFPNSNEYPDYKPHITIGYVKKGLGKKYVNPDYRYLVRNVDKITYSMANGKKFKFEINKLFETLDSYRYIDKLGFQELDKVGLELIRDNFKNLQKEDVRDAFYELEDFGYSIQVLPFIWKGEPLERVNIRFDNDKFSILSTNKQGDGITWNSYPNLKLIHAEFLDDFSDNQINDIRNITSVTDYFKNDIQREINNFSNYLESGYFPCLGFDMRVYKEISKENLNPFWILRNDIKPIINDIRLRLESMGKELIFASKYLFIIVEKKYINPI